MSLPWLEAKPPISLLSYLHVLSSVTTAHFSNAPLHFDDTAGRMWKKAWLSLCQSLDGGNAGNAGIEKWEEMQYLLILCMLPLYTPSLYRKLSRKQTRMKASCSGPECVPICCKARGELEPRFKIIPTRTVLVSQVFARGGLLGLYSFETHFRLFSREEMKQRQPDTRCLSLFESSWEHI